MRSESRKHTFSDSQEAFERISLEISVFFSNQNVPLIYAIAMLIQSIFVLNVRFIKRA